MRDYSRYRRITISPSTGDRLPLYSLFVYLVHKGGNHLQFGLGYESRDELQRIHIPTGIEHIENLPWLLERMQAQGLVLKTGKLKELFGDRDTLILVCKDDAEASIHPKEGARFDDPYIHVGKEFAVSWEIIRNNVQAAESRREALRHNSDAESQNA